MISNQIYTGKEILYSIFSYSKDDFKNLNLKEEPSRWSEELKENSVASPLYIGSPCDDDYDNEHMDLEVDENFEWPQDDIVYVVLYYLVTHHLASNLSLNLSKILFAETVGLFKSKGNTSRYKSLARTNCFSVLNLSHCG